MHVSIRTDGRPPEVTLTHNFFSNSWCMTWYMYMQYQRIIYAISYEKAQLSMNRKSRLSSSSCPIIQQFVSILQNLNCQPWTTQVYVKCIKRRQGFIDSSGVCKPLAKEWVSKVCYNIFRCGCKEWASEASSPLVIIIMSILHAMDRILKWDHKNTINFQHTFH